MKGLHPHGRRQQGSVGNRRPVAPWIFIHGTKRLNNAIFRSFFAIFWSFSVAPHGRGLIMLLFVFVFFAIFWYFFRCPPPGNFSADALVYRYIVFPI